METRELVCVEYETKKFPRFNLVNIEKIDRKIDFYRVYRLLSILMIYQVFGALLFVFIVDNA